MCSALYSALVFFLPVLFVASACGFLTGPIMALTDALAKASCAHSANFARCLCFLRRCFPCLLRLTCCPSTAAWASADWGTAFSAVALVFSSSLSLLLFTLPTLLARLRPLPFCLTGCTGFFTAEDALLLGVAMMTFLTFLPFADADFLEGIP